MILDRYKNRFCGKNLIFENRLLYQNSCQILVISLCSEMQVSGRQEVVRDRPNCWKLECGVWGDFGDTIRGSGWPLDLPNLELTRNSCHFPVIFMNFCRKTVTTRSWEVRPTPDRFYFAPLCMRITKQQKFWRARPLRLPLIAPNSNHRILVNSCQFLKFRKTSADPIIRSATAKQITRNDIDSSLALKNNFSDGNPPLQPAKFLSNSCKVLWILGISKNERRSYEKVCYGYTNHEKWHR